MPPNYSLMYIRHICFLAICTVFLMVGSCDNPTKNSVTVHPIPGIKKIRYSEIEWENPNPNLKFLVLKELNTTERTCYVIYNLNEEHLSIRESGKGGVQVYKIQ